MSEDGADDEDEEFDWEIEQTPYEEVSESTLQSQCYYGFGNLRAGVVQRLQVCCPKDCGAQGVSTSFMLTMGTFKERLQKVT